MVNSGIQVVVWAGDADWICNWLGNLGAVNAVSWSGTAAFASQALIPYTVDGAPAGTFKTLGNLSFARIFGAGHEVPFYTPQAALQVFQQTMSKRPLSST